nr:hypothetical protein [Tanacetum cinerariifolium]
MLDDSKYKFKFFLDTEELTMSVASFRRILQLPQAIDNNNAGFVDARGFSLITFQEKYHIVENDDLVKSIFNSGKNKEGEGMLISMLTEEIKVIGHYKMYAAVFRDTNPINTEGESSAQRKSTVVRFCILRRQDIETPIPTVAEIDVTNFDETIQMSIATHRSIKDFEAQQNVEKVKEHIVDEEIENLVEGIKNVNVDEFMNDIFNDQEKHDNKIDPESYKESLDAKKSVDDVTITKIAMTTVPIYVDEGLLLDKQKTQVDVAAMIVETIQKERENLWADISLQVTNALANNDEKLRNDDLPIWWSLKIKFDKLTPSVAPCRTDFVRTRDHEDHLDDDTRPEGESNAKRQKTSEYGTYSV